MPQFLRVVALYLAALAMAGAAFAVLTQFHAGEAEHMTRAVRDLLSGRAELRAFQNRILSPALVAALAQTGLPYVRAVAVYHLICLMIEAVLVVGLLRRMSVPPVAALYTLAALLFGFLVLQDRYFFAWDSLDLVLFTLLAFVAVGGLPMPLWGLVTLFAVALFNRESALFIAAYIAMLGLGYERGRLVLRDARTLALGLGLAAGGALLTKLMRDLLFRHSPVAGDDTANSLLGNQLVLLVNLTQWPAPVVMAGLAALVGGLWWLAMPLDERRLRYLAVMTLMTVATMVFGYVTETRTLFTLLPFVVLMPLLPARARD